MTKTKAQLRAEAVERLRNCYYTSDSDLMRAMLNWGHEPHTGDDSRFALIGLLTDEELQDGTTPEFDVPLYGWHEGDTREKLEADCEKLIGNIQRRIFSGRDAGALRCQLKELLDRQAAITTQECNDVYGSGCEACRSSQKRKIAELQEQLDTMRDVTREFRDERDEWKAKAKKRDFKDEMADLLFRIQIPLNVQREYLKKVSQDSEMDSRERLEAEIRYEYNGSISNEAEQIIEWLDRQAAITKMEMQAKVDELEAENARLRSCISDDAEYGRLVMDAYRELRAKLGAIREAVSDD